MDIRIGNFDDLASMLGVDGPDAMTVVNSEPVEVNDIFQNFKLFAAQYVQTHDQVPPDHQIIEQILNSGSIDDIETYLRNGLDYCDECLVSMFKKFVSGPVEPEEDACGCGGDEPSGEEHTPFPDKVGPG